MKRKLPSVLVLLAICSYASAQTLYSNTVESGFKTNPNLSQLGTPKVDFDDLDIPSSSIAGSDSMRITKVKVGIARVANAVATSVSIYYTTVDDTATLRNNKIKIPPVLIGTVNLPANGPTPGTTIVSLGDSVSTLFRVKTTLGNLFPGFSTFFIGIALSVPGSDNGISLTSGISPNDNTFWVYNADSTVKRFNASFGATPPNPPSTFYIQAFGYPVGGALPVTISGFKGERKGNINNLSWTTLTEQNNKGFELQRSADGINFSSLAFIASKAAGGSNAGPLQYSFVDGKPFIGTAYYRLIQTDKDGKTTVSNIVSIKAANVTSLQVSSIYPNPATNILNLVVVAPGNDYIKLLVTDITGKLAMQTDAALNSGNNNLSINVAKLSPGNYKIKLICASGCELAISTFVKE